MHVASRGSLGGFLPFQCPSDPAPTPRAPAWSPQAIQVPTGVTVLIGHPWPQCHCPERGAAEPAAHVQPAQTPAAQPLPLPIWRSARCPEYHLPLPAHPRELQAAASSHPQAAGHRSGPRGAPASSAALGAPCASRGLHPNCPEEGSPPSRRTWPPGLRPWFRPVSHRVWITTATKRCCPEQHPELAGPYAWHHPHPRGPRPGSSPI